MSANATNHEDIKSHEPMLLTAKQAAVVLSISPRKLWSLTSGNEVPHIRIGRSVRYSVIDLEDWISEQRCTASRRNPIVRNKLHQKSGRSSPR